MVFHYTYTTVALIGILLPIGNEGPLKYTLRQIRGTLRNRY